MEEERDGREGKEGVGREMVSRKERNKRESVMG